MRRCLKILLVKSEVTSPYQIKENIVSRFFLLKDANLSLSVPAWEILGIEECDSVLSRFRIQYNVSAKFS